MGTLLGTATCGPPVCTTVGFVVGTVYGAVGGAVAAGRQFDEYNQSEFSESEGSSSGFDNRRFFDRRINKQKVELDVEQRATGRVVQVRVNGEETILNSRQDIGRLPKGIKNDQAFRDAAEKAFRYLERLQQ